MKIWFIVAGVFLFHLVSRCLSGYAQLENPLPLALNFIDVVTTLLIFIPLFGLYILGLTLNYHNKAVLLDPSEEISSLTSYIMANFSSLVKLGICFALLYILGSVRVFSGNLSIFSFNLLVLGFYLAFVTFTTLISLRILKKFK